MRTVHIEFISDFICPWCYIGKARLDRLQTKLETEIQLQIVTRPFILYPFIPKGGLPKEVFAKKTKPGMGRSLKYESEIEGVQLNYRHIERIPNSLEAHRLVWLSRQEAAHYSLAKQIFADYFERGQNIEDYGYLMSMASQMGVSQKVQEQFSNSQEGEEEITEYLKQIKEEFVSIVPSLRLDGKFLLPGLQPEDVWEQYIRRAAKLPKAP